MQSPASFLYIVLIPAMTKKLKPKANDDHVGHRRPTPLLASCPSKSLRAHPALWIALSILHDKYADYRVSGQPTADPFRFSTLGLSRVEGWNLPCRG